MDWTLNRIPLIRFFFHLLFVDAFNMFAHGKIKKIKRNSIILMKKPNHRKFCCFFFIFIFFIHSLSKGSSFRFIWCAYRTKILKWIHFFLLLSYDYNNGKKKIFLVFFFEWINSKAKFLAWEQRRIQFERISNAFTFYWIDFWNFFFLAKRVFNSFFFLLFHLFNIFLLCIAIDLCDLIEKSLLNTGNSQQWMRIR